jgi:hypothetical protein
MHINLFKRSLTGAGTTYGESVYVEVSDFVAANVVTAVSGTLPEVDVTLQDSPDGKEVTDANATWFDLLAFTQATAAGAEAKSFIGPHFERVRAVVTLGGTAPEATVDVTYSGAAAARTF